MIVEELRVGNIVTYYEDLKPFACSVNDMLNCELLIPIPLTEHWLERFGFRKIKDEKSYCEDGDYTLVSNRFQVFTNDILTYNSIHGWWIDKKQFFIPCQYVHQLQNFHFALTGKELELTKQ